MQNNNYFWMGLNSHGGSIGLSLYDFNVNNTCPLNTPVCIVIGSWKIK